MKLTLEENDFLESITANGGGKDIHELMMGLELNYEEIENMVQTLISKGVELTVLHLDIGRRHKTMKRVYLSPYQEKTEVIN